MYQNKVTLSLVPSITVKWPIIALFMPIFKSSTIIAYVLQNKKRNDVQLSVFKLHSYGLHLFCQKI